MPNMFRCTLASGGGVLVLTVTCDADFAGLTITATDGTTTLTQPCPSTSPYTVEFKIPNGGTWTISSGTDSTSVVIPDSIELHNIPNGSTITPINNIQIWLHCANIWDKSYTTITQVLNDASTLQALIASNNAVDYMARSTSWASDVTANSSAMTYIGLNNYCANKLLGDSTWLNAILNSTYFEQVLNVKVPTMTSNTQPSGTVRHNSTATGEGYKAFDGNASTNFEISGSAVQTKNWLSYQFPSAVNIKKIYLYCLANSAKSFKIQGSNDGTNWTDLGTFSNIPSNVDNSYIISNSNKYTYYRFYELSLNNSSNWRIYTLQLYGRA